jgi:hypothetical protein
MEVSQRLVFCKRCAKKGFSAQSGVVCSLTNEKPTFETTCADFILDEKEEKRVTARDNQIEQDKKAGNYQIWVAIGIVLIIIKIVLRFMR